MVRTKRIFHEATDHQKENQGSDCSCRRSRSKNFLICPRKGDQIGTQSRSWAPPTFRYLVMLVAALGATLEVALLSLVADFLLRMKELRPRILEMVDPKRPAKESFFLGTYSSPICRSHAAVRSASCAKMRCRRLAIIPLRRGMRRKESIC